MKTTIGGDRLGSGNKQQVTLKHYNRSTHDLSYIWRSSMSAGTLVPFMVNLALPGDSFDIDLNCEVLTLPTVGPLFGSFKVQLDVFQVPIRLYNAALHMNKLGIGRAMQNVYLPQLEVKALNKKATKYGKTDLRDNAQVNPSSLLKYLGISGVGHIVNGAGTPSVTREFNGVPFLGYWDIYKNYYANKQEETGKCIHISEATLAANQTIIRANVYSLTRTGLRNEWERTLIGDTLNNGIVLPAFDERLKRYELDIQLKSTGQKIKGADIQTTMISPQFPQIITDEKWVTEESKLVIGLQWPDNQNSNQTLNVLPQSVPASGVIENSTPSILSFPLENIDLMREKILQAPTSAPFKIALTGIEPYKLVLDTVSNGEPEPQHMSMEFGQDLLALKTYQSDLFNNWISTEWIDGANGVNEVSSVDTTGDSFTIDALNLASKVYNMLNRIAISGGSYDDWLDAVYTHERAKSVESPVYLGSLIKELAFEEVISQSEAESTDVLQPLGTLAGKGRLTNKNKGGKIRAKIDEPSYIIGLVSLTPRIDYSQGNNWDVNLRTMNDFHKPALDAIGFQELITEQMAWQDSIIAITEGNTTITHKSAGKQPAWINYMTAVNKTYGNFAIKEREMFMTLNRRYELDLDGIKDLTTYIDPTKFNFIFAQTNIDAQNFWVQIGNNIRARRKMSAKVIPNL